MGPIQDDKATRLATSLNIRARTRNQWHTHARAYGCARAWFS